MKLFVVLPVMIQMRSTFHSVKGIWGVSGAGLVLQISMGLPQHKEAQESEINQGHSKTNDTRRSPSHTVDQATISFLIFLIVKQDHSEKNNTNRSPYMEQGDWGAICRADGAGDNTSLPSRLMSGANNMQKSCGNGYAIAGECAAIIGLN